MQEGVDLETEHAGVPEVLARLHVCRGRRQIGFFDKAAHGVARVQRVTGLDVAETGFRAAGLDAEGDEPFPGGQHRGLLHGLGKRIYLAHQMVGRQHQQQRMATQVFGGMQRRHGDRRGGVAAVFLQQKHTTTRV